jgi:hypothetical protein
VAWQTAARVTELIRHARSSRSLGFGTAVRAELTLPAADRVVWPLIQNDVFAGNNVLDLSPVRFADDYDVQIEPVPAS